MDDPLAGWWTLRRGAFRFAVYLGEGPRCISGADVWWTPSHAFFCGLVSGPFRPVGVLDISHVLALPGGEISEDSWVMASPGSKDAWALVSDDPPEPLMDEAERSDDVPWLPTSIAREHIRSTVVSEGESFLMVDPLELQSVKIVDASFQVSDERLTRRTARIDVEETRRIMRPSLLATRVDDGWWALRSDLVQRVVRVTTVNPLPGAARPVMGLAAITGRVNVIVDPGKLLGKTPASTPCWVTQVKSKETRWGVAATEEWHVLAEEDVQQTSDHTPVPGPPGLVVQRLRYGNDAVFLLSLERLADLSKGADGAAEGGHE